MPANALTLKWLLLVAGVLLTLAPANGQSKAPAEEDAVRYARVRFNEVNGLIQSGRTHPVRFVAIGGGRGDLSTWEVAPSELAYERSLAKATAFLSGSKALKVSISVVSPSGDWSVAQEVYFDPAESMVFTFNKHTTIRGYDYRNDKELPDGPYTLEERLYATQGGVVRRLVKAYIGKTGQELHEEDLSLVPMQIYLHARELPFHEQLPMAK